MAFGKAAMGLGFPIGSAKPGLRELLAGALRPEGLAPQPRKIERLEFPKARGVYASRVRSKVGNISIVKWLPY
jgi:hypothetical protein